MIDFNIEQVSSAYLSSKDAQTLCQQLKSALPALLVPVKKTLDVIISKLDSVDNQGILALGEELIRHGVAGSSGLEVELFAVFKEVFEIYVARGDYRSAANSLSKVGLQKDDCPVPLESRFKYLLNLITAFLELKESISCEPLLRKTHEIASQVKDIDLQIQYNYCCGQYFDFGRKFLQSAYRYYEACNKHSEGSTSQEALVEILSKAIDATILSPTGSKKAFLIANLIKDERAKQFKNYQLLQKMARDVTISNEEMGEFAQGLKNYQNIREGDGFTTLEKVIFEHNILVFSKVYKDIRIESLAKKIGVSGGDLESILQNMKNEEKIDIEIDHKTSSITFKRREGKHGVVRDSLAVFYHLLDTVQV